MIIESATIIAVVIGLTQVIKLAGLPIRFIPSVALVIGIVLSFIVGGQEVGALIFSGLIYGLSAAGFYSGAKTTITATPEVPTIDTSTPDNP